ncbi:hypothetical protein ACLOJK_037764, partial [Asimina triloba]
MAGWSSAEHKRARAGHGSGQAGCGRGQVGRGEDRRRLERVARRAGERVQAGWSGCVAPRRRYGSRRGHGGGPQAPGRHPPRHGVPQPTG